MILRTLLFLLVLYILIRVISRLFLPSREKQGSSGFFYRHFSSENSGRQQGGRSHFDEIEEAEYEDVTEEQSESRKKSD
ncbi:MAG: hypothetical protein R3211_02625 [Balneolaceae bacterium]|nr:hypothetical protein [Balneolaceae bacterium]